MYTFTEQTEIELNQSLARLTRADIQFFLEELRAGRVNGGSMVPSCGCLFGTVARGRGYNSVFADDRFRALVVDARGYDVDVYNESTKILWSPDNVTSWENVLMAVSTGDTPETSKIAAAFERVCVEFLASNQEAV